MSIWTITLPGLSPFECKQLAFPDILSVLLFGRPVSDSTELPSPSMLSSPLFGRPGSGCS